MNMDKFIERVILAGGFFLVAIILIGLAASMVPAVAPWFMQISLTNIGGTVISFLVAGAAYIYLINPYKGKK